MNRFSNKTIDELGYYVYALTDPRDGKIFYIGKGCGNRVFYHCEAAIREEHDSLKLNLIREIIASGAEIGHYILRHKLSEEEAFKIESTLIDLLTYNKFNTKHILTNIQSGHHRWDEGIKTVEEINSTYDCEKIIVNPNDRLLLLVNLNNSFDDKKAYDIYRRPNIYEKTRKYWVISKERADKVDYVLGVYHNIVRAVIKVKGHEWTNHSDEGIPFKQERCCFIGDLLNETESPYLNKDVSDYPFGSGGAIRYIPKNKNDW